MGVPVYVGNDTKAIEELAKMIDEGGGEPGGPVAASDVQNDSTVTGATVKDALGTLKTATDNAADFLPTYSMVNVKDSVPDVLVALPGYEADTYPKIWLRKAAGENKVDIGVSKAGAGSTQNFAAFAEGMQQGGTFLAGGHYATVNSAGSILVTEGIVGQMGGVARMFIEIGSSTKKAFEVFMYCVGMPGGGDPGMNIHMIVRRVR